MKFYFNSILAVLVLSLFISCGDDDNEPQPDLSSCQYFSFKELDQEVREPNCVNILFQVMDGTGKGVIDLTEENFLVQEDGQLISSESNLSILPNQDIPYTIQTVLLLDISSSVTDEIENIKNAARTLVQSKAENQEIAVYTFSSTFERVLNFSFDENEIINAIQSIEVGTSSTNLYGALIGVSNSYLDFASLDVIRRGNIVLFSDGDDTQGSTEIEDVQNALQLKDFYVVALNGPDFDSDAVSAISTLNPKLFLVANSTDELSAHFETVNEDIIRLSESTYWLYFSSPKRGDIVREVELSFACNNENLSITGSYSSRDFIDGECIP